MPKFSKKKVTEKQEKLNIYAAYLPPNINNKIIKKLLLINQ